MKYLLVFLMLFSISTVNSKVPNNRSSFGCHTPKPILKIYTDAVELSFKATSRVSGNTEFNFVKKAIPSNDVRTFLLTEYGKKFVANSCHFNGFVFGIKETYAVEFEIYEVSYDSEESAEKAAKFLNSLKKQHVRTKKVMTKFEWKQVENTILITFYDRSLSL